MKQRIKKPDPDLGNVKVQQRQNEGLRSEGGIKRVGRREEDGVACGRGLREEDSLSADDRNFQKR